MKKYVFFVLYFMVSIAFAQTAATVLSVVNQVFAQSGANKRALTRGASIAVGEAIVTGADGRAQIKYGNGTLVSIAPNSNYRIDQYTPNNPDLQNTATLSNGKIESTTQKQKKAILKTPVVALAILGTEFKAATDGKTLDLVVTSGLVTGNGIDLGPGASTTQGTFSSDGSFKSGPPANPVDTSAGGSSQSNSGSTSSSSSNTDSSSALTQSASVGTSSGGAETAAVIIPANVSANTVNNTESIQMAVPQPTCVPSTFNPC